ncbi:MAG: prenyltransferase/squalene oxidase repeat-containing protein [Planctomycetota bacterium]|jgi:hypothetical protein
MSWNAHVYEEEYFPARSDTGIQEALNDAAKKAPWWLVSAAVHGLVAVVLTLAHFTEYRPDSDLTIMGGIEEPEQDDPMEDLKRDPFDDEKPIPTDEPALEDPVMKDAELADHNETDDNEEGDSSKGVEYAQSDVPFKSNFWASPIGIGGGGGGKFGHRIGGKRDLRARIGGLHTYSAVVLAQNWLKDHQNPDGMWSCDKFMMNCKKGSCSGAGSHAEYDTGVTGLALLAFLGAGQTHKHGRYKTTVRKALKALKERQTPDGCFGPKSADGHWIYNHAIASMAMAEAYGMSGESPLLKIPAQKGIDFLVDCQNPYLGWRYGRQTGASDTSVTGWAVLALKSAKIAGLEVPEGSFEGALNWLDKATDESYYKTGYTSKGDTGARLPEVMGKFQSTEAMTAVAVISRIFIQGPPAAHRPEVLGGANLLKQNPPKWDVRGGTIDMYYWYYGTLAMFQLGKSYWKPWNEAMKDALVPTQRRDGCEGGSWDPIGAWGTAGGRVYSTAINCLSLEIYYRYGRILNVR